MVSARPAAMDLAADRALPASPGPAAQTEEVLPRHTDADDSAEGHAGSGDQSGEPAEAAARQPVDETYHAASELSQSPRPVTAPQWTYPEEGLSAGRYTVVLALYIDEDGLVRRAEVESLEAPVVLQDMARQGFLRTRFYPGQMKGHVVRSRMRVEVAFESRQPV